MTGHGPGGLNGPHTPHTNGSPICDWRKGSADIKLLLKNLYTQSPMLHTDVTFKVNFSHEFLQQVYYNNLSLTMVTESMLTSLFSPSSVQFLRLSFMEVSIRMERSQSQILNQKYSRCFLDIYTHQYHWM